MKFLINLMSIDKDISKLVDMHVAERKPYKNYNKQRRNLETNLYFYHIREEH